MSLTETVEIAQGVHAPRIGLGTFQLAGRTCRRVVQRALAMGYRHIDTAEGYGNEDEIGRAVRGGAVPRERLFIVSKVWRDHLRPDTLRSHLKGSLRRLIMDYIDLYLVHWPNRDIPAEETVGGLEALRSEGLLRAWGVSNYTETHLEEMLPHGHPATNQVELHPYFRQDELTRFCHRHDIAVTCYSPLARGRVEGDRVLNEIADAHDLTPAQVALRWALEQGDLVIPKASSAPHLRENLDTLEVTLTEEELGRVGSCPQGDRLFDYAWSEFDR